MFLIGSTDYMYMNKEHSHKFYEVLIYTEGKGNFIQAQVMGESPQNYKASAIYQ